MTAQELINQLGRYIPDDKIMLQDSNGFIYDIDFLCTDHIDDIENDIVLLIAGQLQGGGLND